MTASLLARLIEAWGFPVARPALVLAPAAAYAGLHALQAAIETASGPAVRVAALAVGFAGLVVIVIAVTAWLRDRFNRPQPSGALPFALGQQEVQVATSLMLTALLAVMTAAIGFFGVLLLIGGMTLAARDREGLLSEPAPDELVNVFEYFNLFERAVSLGAFALWLLLTLWLFARLSPALPATLESGRVRVLSIWPASRKRAPLIAVSSVLAALPGGVLVWLFGVSAAALGAILAGALQAFAGVAGIAAPLIALWSADHRDWLSAQSDAE